MEQLNAALNAAINAAINAQTVVLNAAINAQTVAFNAALGNERAFRRNIARQNIMDDLEPIRSVVNPNVGNIHEYFPATVVDANALTNVQLNAMQAFYGTNFAGDNVAARRNNFLRFVKGL